MKFYAITYDLRQPGRKYNDLYDAIKTTSGDGNWLHPMESFWVIACGEFSEVNANKVYESLRGFIDDNDSILVTRLEFVDYQGWMPKSLWEWIKEKKDIL